MDPWEARSVQDREDPKRKGIDAFNITRNHAHRMSGLIVLALTAILGAIYGALQWRAGIPQQSNRRTQLFSDDPRDITLRSADNLRLLNEDQLRSYERDGDEA